MTDERQVIPRIATLPERYTCIEQAENDARQCSQVEGVSLWVLADIAAKVCRDLVDRRSEGADPEDVQIVANLKALGAATRKGWRRMYQLRRVAETWPLAGHEGQALDRRWRHRDIDLPISVYSVIAEEVPPYPTRLGYLRACIGYVRLAQTEGYSTRKLQNRIRADYGRPAIGGRYEFLARWHLRPQDDHDEYQVIPMDGMRQGAPDGEVYRTTYQRQDPPQVINDEPI